MSIIGSNILAGASGQGGDYTIARSLRFRSSASAYLNRTPTSAGNRKTWTWSAWVKRGSLSTGSLFATNNATDPRFNITFVSDQIRVFNYNGTSYDIESATTPVYRDPSAWYHIVVALDTTQATNTNRLKIYVNGTQVTSFAYITYPTQNFDAQINTTTAHYISANNVAGNYLDGYLTEINFIDGQALTPSSFGATNASTGVWQPKKYAGTYGTNGFYLPFTDNSGATSTTIGKDFSGNSNNWTPNNISVTAGSTYDSMTDVPTLTSATAANYCVLNPILQNGWWAAPSRGAISNGNLRLSQNNGTAFSTFDVNTSGKWYCELTITSYGQTSAQSEIIVSAKSRSTFEVSYYQGGNKSVNNSVTGYGSSWTTGDVIGIAIDQTGNQVTFYKNGVSQGAISNTFPSETVLVGYYAEGTGTDTIDYNFGQRPFAYTPPTGFVALNTFNLPTPTIGATASTQANKYFDATLYTGNGSTQTITNAGGFSPDLVWAKVRNAAFSHQIYDTVRGATLRLASDSTSAEGTVSTGLTAFNSNGFSLGSDGAINGNGNTFVGWQWRGSDSSAVTNTAGSITSTVSANTSAGFSVVTYTGNGTGGATIGHGLGVAPSMVIVKRRDFADDWSCYHTSLGGTKYIDLNSTAAAGTSIVLWNNTNPSSTVVTLGTSNRINGSSGTYVAYCFAPVAGYSAFTSYIGNGSDDGTFVHLGFSPRFVIIKRTDSTGTWWMFDTARSQYNVVNNELYANTSQAEGTGVARLDTLSNGFKIRIGSEAQINASGGSYVVMAFAENPFKYSLGR